MRKLAIVCAVMVGCAAEAPPADPPDGGQAQPTITESKSTKQEGFTAQNFTGSTLRTLYAIPSTYHGTGQVAVIIQGGYSLAKLQSDQDSFRTANSLHARGTLQVVNSSGQTSPLPGSQGAAAEKAGTAALQIGAALADDANLLVVEAASSSNADLKTAANRAITMGARRIVIPATSASDGGDFNTATHLLVFGSVTQAQGQVEWPALATDVVSVTPTNAGTDTSTRGFGEAGGSNLDTGCSPRSKPGFQTDSVCAANKTMPDMSAIGDSNSLVTVYYTDSMNNQSTIQVSGPGIGPAVLAGWASGDTSVGPSDIWGFSTGAFYKLGAGAPAFDSATGLGSPAGVIP